MGEQGGPRRRIKALARGMLAGEQVTTCQGMRAIADAMALSASMLRRMDADGTLARLCPGVDPVDAGGADSGARIAVAYAAIYASQAADLIHDLLDVRREPGERLERTLMALGELAQDAADRLRAGAGSAGGA